MLVIGKPTKSNAVCQKIQHDIEAVWTLMLILNFQNSLQYSYFQSLKMSIEPSPKTIAHYLLIKATKPSKARTVQ